MFFYASKILYMIVMPSFVTGFLVIVGGWMVLARWRERLGRWMLGAGLVLLMVIGLTPLSMWFLLPLEERFPRPALPQSAVAILVLGGFEDTVITKARGSLAVNDNAERLTEAVVLARRLPDAKVAFTGGDAGLIAKPGSAAGSVGAFFRDAGVAPERIVLEAQSRTTYENARYLADIFKPQPGQTFVLVTSAFHMPRSVGTFRQQGFDVVAWPVDYRAVGLSDAYSFSAKISDGLSRFDFVLKEWIGLAAYYATGRTNALWPGPGP